MWLAGVDTNITHCDCKGIVKNWSIISNAHTAKCRNTGHVVIMALIKQTWQDTKGDHFNRLHQSHCYKTGKLWLCRRGKSKWLRWFGELATTDRPVPRWLLERGGQGELFWWYRGTESKNRWDREVVGYFPFSERFLSWQEKKPLTTAQLVFHLNYMNMEDDEWTHKSDIVGESKAGEHFREETANYYLHFFCHKKQTQVDLHALELEGFEDLLCFIPVACWPC